MSQDFWKGEVPRGSYFPEKREGPARGSGTPDRAPTPEVTQSHQPIQTEPQVPVLKSVRGGKVFTFVLNLRRASLRLSDSDSQLTPLSSVSLCWLYRLLFSTESRQIYTYVEGREGGKMEESTWKKSRSEVPVPT